MNRKRAVFVLIPMLGILTGYLFFFWQARLEYFGVVNPLPAVLLTGISLAMAVYRPIPVKIRTICVLHLVVFGILADVADRLLTGPVWQMLHGSGLAVLSAMGLMLAYGAVHGRKVTCRRYEVSVKKSLFKPLRIGLLSDIHMGLCVNRQKLDQVCRALEEENLDLLLLAGDLCDDYTSREDMHYAIRRLGQIPAAQGKFCVFGNHDLASHGPALQYTEEELRQALSHGDIRLLDEQTAAGADWILLGRRDLWMAQRWGGRRPAAELLPPDAGDKVILVLDHQPYGAREAALAGADLQFSGHTHAGQVWPASWLGRLRPEFYGRHSLKGMTLVVSSGLGGRGSRLRSGCSAEYVIVDIQEEKGSS